MNAEETRRFCRLDQLAYRCNIRVQRSTSERERLYWLHRLGGFRRATDVIAGIAPLGWYTSHCGVEQSGSSSGS